MPRKQRSSWSRSLFVLMAVLGLLATSCGNSSDDKKATGSTSTTASTPGSSDGKVTSVDAPGVTKDEIRFSAIGTQEGNPLGTCVLTCYANGIKAYFAYRNSQGGIYGRKLVLSKELDDQLSQNQVRALEVITANDTFANFNAAQIANGWADLAKAGIPTYVWSINPAEMTGKPSIFGYREVLCITCSTRWSAYVANLAGAKKVATLGYGVSENSKQCAQGAAESIKQYGPEVGAEVAYTNPELAFGLPNGIGPEVTAMKKAGVDFVVGCIDLNGMKTLAQELKRQGMNDSVTLFHSNTYDQKFVREAGDLFEGDYVQASFRPFEAASTPSLAAYKKWMKAAGNDLNELAMVGWINADLAYKGIKAAGPNFSRQKVIDATNKMTAYTADGLTQPIDWSRQHEPPTQDDPKTHGPAQDCAVFVKVKNGAFQIVGNKSKPWFCWPGTTRAWSEPKAMNFK